MKKLLSVFAISTATVLLVGCNNNSNTQPAPSTEVSDISDINALDDTLKDISGGKILSTEYTIVDYCKECLVVSNTSGTLYGVIDANNKIIVPVEYDSITILDEDNLRTKPNKNIFFKAKYEDEYSIFNRKGDKILEGDVKAISYEKATPDRKAYFYKVTSDKLYVYDVDGKEIASIDYNFGKDGTCTFIGVNKDRLFATCTTYDVNGTTVFTNGDIYLFDGSINEISKWEGYLASPYQGFDGDTFYLGAMSANDCLIINLNSDGTVTEISITEGELNKMLQDKIINKNTDDVYDYLGDNDQYRMFTSNDTWKLEDENGDPLFEKRYFKAGHIDKAYFFTNEDDEACVITKNGDLVVDFGRMYYDGETVVFDGARLTDDNTFADYDSICIVKKETDGKNTAYIF